MSPVAPSAAEPLQGDAFAGSATFWYYQNNPNSSLTLWAQTSIMSNGQMRDASRADDDEDDLCIGSFFIRAPDDPILCFSSLDTVLTEWEHTPLGMRALLRPNCVMCFIKYLNKQFKCI